MRKFAGKNGIYLTTNFCINYFLFGDSQFLRYDRFCIFPSVMHCDEIHIFLWGALPPTPTSGAAPLHLTFLELRILVETRQSRRHISQSLPRYAKSRPHYFTKLTITQKLRIAQKKLVYTITPIIVHCASFEVNIIYEKK